MPYYRIVNAAFCHAHPLGSRFNGPDRGAWYAAFESETAQAEVAFHKWVELAEVDWFEEDVTYDDYLADFSAEFHDVRDDDRFADCLAPDSYLASQDLAQRLLDSDSLGIVYPSVRRATRNMPRLLPAGARHECAQGKHLPLRLERQAKAESFHRLRRCEISRPRIARARL